MGLLDQHIYLASASPRRRELLKQIGVNFEVLLLRALSPRTDVDETPIPGEQPEEYVVRVARAKAKTAWQVIEARRLPKHGVLAADTTVSLNGEILGKPVNRENAEEMLRKLSGKRHRVYTSVAMSCESRLEVKLSVSEVVFAELNEAEIKRYVMTGEPMDKAGGYAIQGRAAAFVSRIEGSYSGVMGLPLYETAQLLKQFGVG